LPSRKKLVLALIDGLTPSAFEAAVEGGRAQTLALLAENGRYVRAASAFPSLTPVCVSSIVTGAHPDVHRIPHLVWYHRGERRVVEYGSSFGAIRRAGMSRSIRDAIVNMNGEHLALEATTIFESLDDAELVSAAVNIPCYRGRTPHRATIPGLTRVVHGPKRFFFYNLFESDVTGAPLAVRNRAGGTIDDYEAAVGRWLVTRDGFDFLAYYLSDHDYLSHAFGPDGAQEGIARADRALGTLVEAAGGADEFLGRYAVVLCSDHGQTRVDHAARKAVTPAEDAHAHAARGERGGLLARERLGQTEQSEHFAALAAPVLLAERVDRQHRDARAQRGIDRALERVHPAAMAFECRQTVGASPAPVSVHDDRDVARNARRDRCALDHDCAARRDRGADPVRCWTPRTTASSSSTYDRKRVRPSAVIRTIVVGRPSPRTRSLVTTPMTLGRPGSTRLRSASKMPSAASRWRIISIRASSAPTPAYSIRSMIS